MRATERRLEEVARTFEPDILHAHSPVLNALPALRVGRRLRHSGRLRGARFLGGRGGRSRHEPRGRPALPPDARPRDLRTASRGTRHDDLRRLEHDIVARAAFRADEVTVIPNAVDVDALPLRRARRTGAQAAARPRRHDGRRLHRLVLRLRGPRPAARALPALLARHPDVRVLLVGGGPQEASLKAWSPNAGSRPRRLRRRVPHAEVQRYYELIDVLVYPRHSMRLTELVTPLKPLEAMAQGRLLVASDVGGHRELIRDGETGVLFRAGDAQRSPARSNPCSNARPIGRASAKGQDDSSKRSAPGPAA